jgi:hypothetical protein
MGTWSQSAGVSNVPYGVNDVVSYNNVAYVSTTTHSVGQNNPSVTAGWDVLVQASNGTSGTSGANGSSGQTGSSGQSGTAGTSGSSVSVSGTNNTYVKFTSATTVGNSAFSIRDNTTNYALNLGTQANSSRYGEVAQAVTSISSSNDIQYGKVMAKYAIASSSTQTLNLSSATDRITVPNNSVIGFVANLIVQDDSNQNVDYRRYEGAIKNVGGSTSLVGVVTEITVTQNSSLFTCAVTADDTNDALSIAVTNSGANTIKCLATVDIYQITKG